MELANPRVTTRIDKFKAIGSWGYFASADDDDAFWRAVEVHVFLDDPPPPPPGPVPPAPCPGGHRFRKWSIVIPASFSGNPIPPLPAVLSGIFVLFRLDSAKPPIVHAYALPAGGGGYSWNTLKSSLEWLKKLLGKISLNELSWTSFTADTPFNFSDLDGATCNIVSVGGGIGPAYSLTRVWVNGPLWFHESSGGCMHKNNMDFFTNVDVSGAQIQFSVGASGVGGPLLKVW